MRIRARFVLLVSAAMLLSLSVAFAVEADRAGMQEILSAPLSPTERDLKLLGWFEQQYAVGAALSEADKETYLELRSRAGDLRGREAVDNQGGPDAFQYMFTDNVPPDDVPYEWIELRGDPGATWLRGLTHFTSVDDGYSRQKLPIGFMFPFYGAVYDCVRVTTNGFLQFTTTATALTNACLPSTSVAGPMIATLWDDLHLMYGGRTDSICVGYRDFGDYFVVEFDGIGHCCAAGASFKFEAVLYPNGNIKLQYNDLVFSTWPQTQSIGIQQAGAAGSAALNYVCNTTGIQPANGRAILFARASGVPNPVTNLTGNYVAPNVVLTWTDPTQDTQGNPITINNVQVWLGAAESGTLLATVNPGVQSYTDLSPAAGSRTYNVRAYRNPYYGAAAPVTVLVGSPSYVNDFETNNGQWVSDPPTAGWEWGTPTFTSGPTAHGGTRVWGTVLAGNYVNNACYLLTLNPAAAIQSPSASVEFWYWYDTEQTWDGCTFQISTDNGGTWMVGRPLNGYPDSMYVSTSRPCNSGLPAWGGHTGGQWAYATIPIGQWVGQSPLFRFRFGSDNISAVYAGFYFDDMVIWGLGEAGAVPRPPTNFSGSYAGGNITLTWTDPTLDINNQPMTVDSIQVWLGQAGTGTRLGSVGPGTQTYVHLNAPRGLQTYSIRAYNDGYASAPVSASVQGAPPEYPNDFESDNGGWVADPPTGGWEWGVPTATAGPAAHSGTKVWGTVLTGNYGTSVCYRLTLVQGQPVTSPDASIEFWRWWDTEANYDGCNFKASVDQGGTWTTVEPTGGYGGMTNTSNACIPSEPAWTGHTGGTWTLVSIPLGQFLGQIPWFRFTFSSDGSVEYPGFYFDDMNITGLGGTGQVPRAPTNLAGNHVSPNVVLTWTDPTLDVMGSPVTLTNLQVWLGSAGSGQLLATVNPGVQTYTHANAPAGHVIYTVRAYANPNYGPGASVNVTVGAPGYAEGFESSGGGWVSSQPGGVWQWGSPTVPTGGPQPHGGTNCWGTTLTGIYPISACEFLDMNPGLTVASAAATVEFWYWVDCEGTTTYDGANFKVSTDGGGSWTLVTPQAGYNAAAFHADNLCIPGEAGWSRRDSTWRFAVMPIGQFVGQTPVFRFTFGSDPYLSYRGFFFDDMEIWGLRSPSSVTGTVRKYVTSQPIAGAQVWAEGVADTVLSSASGVYELPLDPGTYTLHFRHIHHCDTIHSGVAVETGSQTVRNAVMRAPNGQISVTSLTLETPLNVNVVDSFRITNSSGQCPLSFTISDTSAWLSVDMPSGSVPINQAVTVYVQATVTGMAEGDYVSALLVTYNSTGSPADIRVDLHVEPSSVDGHLPLPTEFAYYQNYPNPFNAQTSLRFDVPQQSRVRIAVFNIVGQEVARPVDAVHAPGRYRLLYDASGLPSGMYLVKMTAADYTKIGKMMLLK